MKIQKKIPLKDWASWKVGGPAEYLCIPSNLEELKQAYTWAREKKILITPLSGGTNVLISDQGISGLVILLNKLNSIEVKQESDHIFIEALAGASKGQLFKIFSQHQLAPALFLCGLPGDVGGGVVMNAGVSYDIQPFEFSQIVHWVEVLCDGRMKNFKKEELVWKYRSCKGFSGIIYKVGFKWHLKKLEDFHKKVRVINRKRLSSQPLNHPSCGSVFVNPPNEKAGRLIEKSGLKGFKIGGAEISDKHANFIVNKNKATALDIHNIICHVQKTVKEKFDIQLETEIKYLGLWKENG